MSKFHNYQDMLNTTLSLLYRGAYAPTICLILIQCSLVFTKFCRRHLCFLKKFSPMPYYRSPKNICEEYWMKTSTNIGHQCSTIWLVWKKIISNVVFCHCSFRRRTTNHHFYQRILSTKCTLIHGCRSYLRLLWIIRTHWRRCRILVAVFLSWTLEQSSTPNWIYRLVFLNLWHTVPIWTLSVKLLFEESSSAK